MLDAVKALSTSKKTSYCFVLMLLLVFPVSLFAQTNNSNLDSIVNNYLYSNNSYGDVFEFVNQHSIRQEIVEIQNYLSHENRKVRGFMYGILFKMILNEEDDKAIRNAVFILIENGLYDSDAGNIYRVINYLDELPEAFFDGKIKNRLASLVLEQLPHFSKLIRLVGRVNVVQLLSYFELSLQNQKDLSASEIWNINLVLARWGDDNRAEYCLESVQRIGMSDEVIFRLVPDLIFTKQRIVFDYLFEVILTDELLCTSTDPDNEVAINCAYRLMEYIAPHIQNFPLKLTNSNELDVENYEEALLKVRAWIEMNQQIYQIILD